MVLGGTQASDLTDDKWSPPTKIINIESERHWRCVVIPGTKLLCLLLHRCSLREFTLQGVPFISKNEIVWNTASSKRSSNRLHTLLDDKNTNDRNTYYAELKLCIVFSHIKHRMPNLYKLTAISHNYHLLWKSQ